jgi:hypothetical protein
VKLFARENNLYVALQNIKHVCVLYANVTVRTLHKKKGIASQKISESRNEKCGSSLWLLQRKSQILHYRDSLFSR